MSTSYFQGKIAIVTGGSKGIGRATTIALANTGCQVVFTYTSDSDACTKLVTEIGQDKVIGIKSNAGNIDDIEHLIQTVVEKFGRIDIIIANAGISPAIVSIA
jgi:NAD(P)-dependent dehydrogenase (short-subunit alcohol dehydrogenase family)